MKRRKWEICGLLLALLALGGLKCPARGEALAASAPSYSVYAAQMPAVYAGEERRLYTSAGQKIAVGESFSFSVAVEEDIFAYPVLAYRMAGSGILENQFSLRVDGALPYAECGALRLQTLWLGQREFALDRYGNEVAGVPEKFTQDAACRLYGKAGLYSRGMGLLLTAGEHRITLTCAEGPFELLGFSLQGEIPVGEAQKRPTVQGEAQTILLEAERADVRTNANIRAASSSDVRLTPYGEERKLLNYIEDASNAAPGNELRYRFSVEEEGLYSLTLHYRQAGLEDFPVFRTVYLDGAIPSPAFDTAALDYRPDFSYFTFTDAADGGPALLYLAAGEHTLTLQTTLDPVRETLEKLQEITDEMAGLSLNITKITGGNTHRFRDFDLEKYGFQAREMLQGWAGELEAVRNALLSLSGKSACTGAIGNLQLCIDKLWQLSERPNDLPKKLSQFSQGSSSVRLMLISMAQALSQSPMGLDSLCLATDAALAAPKASLGARTAAWWRRFTGSFAAQDYEAGSGASQGSLQVWVNRSRQYLEIMQQMADTGFTAETGIRVDFSIMPDESKLTLASVSASAPDVALGVNSGRTYDLAVRGALKDLRGFEDFQETGRAFPAGLLMPGVCGEGMYALPETANFYVLYYRTDILSSLGLEPPDCYEDVLRLLPILQRYGLNYNNFISNAIGTKSFSFTTPFLYQCGGGLYETGRIRTALGDERNIQALKLLTDSFVVYDMDYEVASFYQGFRDGTLPVGTSDYLMYLQLTNAAPELAGRWEIALYPGVTDENGVVQRWTSGAAQSCLIFDSTEMAEEAWRFLQWWMSEKTQTEFAFRLQATMGTEYLWCSANTAAFMNAPWPEQHKRIIAEQMNWIYETPRVPGDYMAERELSNVINAVALNGENLRAQVNEATKRIDREVERKLEEFGWLENGRLTRPFVIPDLETIRGWLQ